jgi:hypothetical protein
MGGEMGFRSDSAFTVCSCGNASFVHNLACSLFFFAELAVINSRREEAHFRAIKVSADFVRCTYGGNIGNAK